jgi:hypothetical protein
MKFIKACSLVVAFILVNSIQADVLASSMIQTPGREVLAGSLKVGDTVYSANDRLKKLGLAKVTAVKKLTTDKYVEIDTGNSVIHAAPDQLFFDTKKREWVKARDLTRRNTLMGHNRKGHALVNVMKRRGNHEIVQIDLSPDHVLFNEELVTHNNPIALGALGMIALRFIGSVIGSIIIGETVIIVKKTVDQKYENAIKQQESMRVNGKPQGPTITRQPPMGARAA